MPYIYNPFTENLDYYGTPPVLSGTISDHGQLTGLSDDDHPLYHTDTRGDVRYYTKTNLDAGQLDIRYYTETEVDTVSGSLQTNIDGKSDTGHTHTEVNITDLDKYTQAEVNTISGVLSSEIDLDISTHSSSAGHDGRYYTETELDAGQLDTRYYTESEVNTISGALSTEIDSDISTHVSSADHDDRYYTEAEVDALTWTESDIIDLDKYTQSEVNTISGSLQINIDGKDNYSSWSFAVDGVTKDAITSGDILNFVGGDNITITRSAEDEITISGTDTYEIVYIDAAAMIPCTTDGALQGTNEYGTNDIDMDYFAFDAGATEERVQFKLRMPENWDKGTIKVKFDWSSATGSTTNDTVEWAIKAGALSDSDVIDAALGTPQVISDVLLANNGTDLQTTSAAPALTIGGTPAKNDLLIFEIYRNTDGTDNMAEDLWLFGVTLQYKKSGTTTAW